MNGSGPAGVSVVGAEQPAPWATDSTPGTDSATQSLDLSWVRDTRWWGLSFYVIAVLSGVLAAQEAPSRTGAVLVVTALVVLITAYALFGRQAARTQEPAPTAAYLVIALPCTLVIVSQATEGTLLLFAVFSQIWMLNNSVRMSVVLVGVLGAGTTPALAWAANDGNGLTWAAVGSIAPHMIVAMAFTLGIGLWIAHYVHVGARNAGLLDELRAAQAELARSHHDAGVSAERERLAREIHDTLAQGFTSVIMLAQAGRADLERGASEAALGRFALVETTARDNLAEARALVAAFSPAPLQYGSLADALTRLTGRFGAETGLQVDAVIDPVANMSAAGDVVVLRCAQEALANVRRHADASRVQLTLAKAPGRAGETGFRLEVHDDGVGVGTSGAAHGPETGFGVRGMRERATAEGGYVDITAGAHGAGTCVTLWLPDEVLNATGTPTHTQVPASPVVRVS